MTFTLFVSRRFCAALFQPLSFLSFASLNLLWIHFSLCIRWHSTYDFTMRIEFYPVFCCCCSLCMFVAHVCYSVLFNVGDGEVKSKRKLLCKAHNSYLSVKQHKREFKFVVFVFVSIRKHKFAFMFCMGTHRTLKKPVNRVSLWN